MGHKLVCDLADDYSGTVQAGQVLGEPLEFDGGEAVVEDEDDARELALLHKHVEYAGETVEASDETGEQTEPDEEFDAEAFVDRTPVSDVVDDIESGEYDDHLDEILEAEQENRDRKSVQDAVSERR
jgi:hypothetical protein